MKAEPKTICTYPGCNALIPVTQRRCPRHPYPPRPKGLRENRPSSTARGYDDDWRHLRRSYLARHPFCEGRWRCRGDPAQEVDHRIPIRSGGARLDPANLQALCGPCHKWKTSKIDRRLPKAPQ